MNQCVYCGEVFRSVWCRCPHCGEPDNATEVYRVRFDRLQLAISLSHLKSDETARFQTEALTLLRQDIDLAELARRLEAQDGGRYARFAAILRNLSSGGTV